MAVFDRGDIVTVRFDPVEGYETRGDNRPALVRSTREFNRLGDVLVIPITQGGDFSSNERPLSISSTACSRPLCIDLNYA
jgi:mRNA interferase ChpB